MIRFRTCALLFASLAIAPLAASADAPSYNDDGMHFDAPANFTKIDLPPTDPTGSDDGDAVAPLAAFVYHAGKTDQQTITITVKRFDGSVAEFDKSHVGELRKVESTFVAKNELTTLKNGMPAYYLKTNGGETAGAFVQHFEYLVCDGTRGIDLSYGGPSGAFDESSAKAVLSTLYVVVYPRHRN
ncbi:MAG: hypothetical protein IAI49_14410 [Candidatus Eremiobacteraeota bacterium]|nr:hypothetical protein [Candidatus Eremiobacteraeota bacterium]